MRQFYIYKYTNLAHPNKKIYVGQAVNLEKRQNEHHAKALRGNEDCPKFYNAIRKYGYENFKCEIIDTIFGTQEDADEREIYWIKELDAKNRDTGMNIAIGGKGGGGNKYECNTDTHKYCPNCEEIKLRECFDKAKFSSNGLATYCKNCNIEIKKEWWESLSEDEKEIERKTEREYRASVNDDVKEKRNKRYKDRNKIYRAENEKLTRDEIYARTPMKYCPKCDEDLASINFNINISKKRGLTDKCKVCQSKIQKEKYLLKNQ